MSRLKGNKVRVRTQTTVDITMWWVQLVNKITSEVANKPLFLVRAKTWKAALAKIEMKFDREEWPKEYWELKPQIVEFGEMGPDVAYL